MLAVPTSGAVVLAAAVWGDILPRHRPAAPASGSAGVAQLNTRPAQTGSVQAPVAPNGDAALLAALRNGDEDAFTRLVQRYHASLVRTALAYVRDREVAEEVIQDTWLAVIKGLDRFEGRSSLGTWIFRIATYQARTRGQRERRSVPLSAFDAGPDEPAVDPDRFRGPEDRWAGGWATPPASWGPDASERVLARETRQVIAATLERLPDAQRTVISLRDVQGWSSDEVCEALDISPGNQRVLLHRARSRVRGALEAYFDQAAAV